ncbi:MAG TPA: hypothetical protein PK580_01725 [Nitrosomonas halophila]|nr:hypothetical protein [Nitrosomonas halophila]
MNRIKWVRILQTAVLVSGMSLAGMVHAHNIAGPIDPAGNVPSFTVVALVTCFDESNDKLVANIKDLSPAVDGMFVNLTLFKGGNAISATDPIPGDQGSSPTITLRGGSGLYYMIINKTKAGTRNVAVDYHCLTENGVHTDTDIRLTTYE